MKNKIMRLLLLIAVATNALATGGFDFGKGAGIVVEEGASLDVTRGIEIVDGFIETNGGEVITDCSPIVGTNATWSDRDGSSYSSITFDGSLRDGSSLSIGDEQSLILDGSLVTAEPVMSGEHCGPSLLRGVGSIVQSGAITVPTNAAVISNINGALGADIVLSAEVDEYSLANPDEVRSTLFLANDLVFDINYGPRAAFIEGDSGINTVAFNGNRMSFGGTANLLDCGSGAFCITQPQVWTDADARLRGPVRFHCNGSITFDTPGRINGNGNALYISSSAAMQNGFNDVALQDLIISGDTSSWFDGGPGAWNCSNVTMINSNGSITINGSFYGTNNVLGTTSTCFGHSSSVYYRKNVNGYDATALVGADSQPLVLGSQHNLIYSDNETGALFYLNRYGKPVYVLLVACDSAGDVVVNDDCRSIWRDSEGRALTSDFGKFIYKTDHTKKYVQYIDEQYVEVSLKFMRRDQYVNFGHANFVKYTQYILGVDSAPVYVDRDSGLLIQDNTYSNQPFLVQIATAAVLNGDEARIYRTGGCTAITDSVGREIRDINNAIIYVDDATFEFLQYDEEAEGYYVVMLSFGEVLDGDGNHILDTTVEHNYERLTYPSTINVTAGDRPVYFDTVTPGMFVLDNNNNPIAVTMNFSFTDEYRSNPSRALRDNNGNQLTIPGGHAVFVDAITGEYVIQASGESNQVINLTFAPVLDSNNIGTSVVHYEEESCSEADATISLNSDVSLHNSWVCTGNATLTIDLNGQALDLSDGSISTVSSGGTVVIRNGVLKGVGGEVFDFHSDSTLILENVELHLESDAYWYNAELIIKGKCRFVGQSRSVFNNRSTANFTISRNATLTLEDGIIYSNNSDATTNFSFCDSSSYLELIGATFRRPDTCGGADPLVLTQGSIIIDHASVMQPGSGGIQFGDGSNADNNLSIIVRPGATLSLSSDPCADVSAGAVIYKNVSSC